MPTHLRPFSRDHLKIDNVFLQERPFVIDCRAIHLDDGSSHGIAVNIQFSRLAVDQYTAGESMIEHDESWSSASNASTTLPTAYHHGADCLGIGRSVDR